MAGIAFMGFVQGESRTQGSLFPVSLDELIGDDHLVRVIDLWVDRVEVGRLGFARAQPKHTGRPPYDPADLLKLYLYGYLNQVRSSRKLEREAQRNIELLWLLRQLRPDFKTIADFRRENGQALVLACRAFVGFCREQSLVTGQLVAIDGSKFGAVASKRKVISKAKLARERERIDARIAQYLAELDAADRSEGDEAVPDQAQLRTTIARLKHQRDNVISAHALMEEMDVAHHVQGEPEARLMKTAQGPSRVAWNVQSAVDGEHGLIIHHEVTDEASDNRQLEPMAKAAQTVLGQAELTVVADAGYSNGAQLDACERSGIAAFVPPNRAINNQGDGALFQKDQFVFDAQRDGYHCPAGQFLARKQAMHKRREVIYAATVCGACPLKRQCTNAKYRHVSRHNHEAALESARARLEADPNKMRERRSLVEHPFGTLKTHILGNGRLLLRGASGARAEMALAVLAYNFRRVSNILGNGRIIEVLATA